MNAYANVLCKGMMAGAAIVPQLFRQLLNTYMVGGQFRTLSLPAEGIQPAEDGPFHKQHIFVGKPTRVELLMSEQNPIVVVWFAWLVRSNNGGYKQIEPYPFYFNLSHYRWQEFAVRPGLVTIVAQPVAGQVDGRFITLIPEDDAEALSPGQLEEALRVVV